MPYRHWVTVSALRMLRRNAPDIAAQALALQALNETPAMPIGMGLVTVTPALDYLHGSRVSPMHGALA